MKSDTAAEPLSDTVRAEAAAWIARLHSSERPRALEAGLRRWLKADPAHARAFEIATEAWEIAGGIRSAALPRVANPFQERDSKRAVARSYLALAAALCAVTIGALYHITQEDAAITTAVGEQRMLTLGDGTRIFLNTDTRVSVVEDSARRHVKLEKGEALFDVTKDPQRPFVVSAGDKEVVALGTSFVVRRDPEQLVVTLMEGKVIVSGAQSPRDSEEMPSGETVLTPGQRLTFATSNAPKLDEPAIEKVTAWRRGEVILDKTRLQDAAEEMNRYSAVRLVVDEPEVANIRVSGIFRAGDSARFARAVAETYQLNVEQESRRIRISAARAR